MSKFRNQSTRPGTLVVKRKGQQVGGDSEAAIFEEGLEVWRLCQNAREAFRLKLEPGSSWQQRVDHVLGDAILMEDTQCDIPCNARWP